MYTYISHTHAHIQVRGMARLLQEHAARLEMLESMQEKDRAERLKHREMLQDAQEHLSSDRLQEQVLICICLYVCMYVCMYVCNFRSICRLTAYKNRCLYAFVRMYVCMYVCMQFQEHLSSTAYKNRFLCAFVCMYVYMYAISA